MNTSYQVLESNAGNLTLEVCCQGNLIYVNFGYEFNVGDLSDDLNAIHDGCRVSEWDNNKIDGYTANDGDTLIAHGYHVGARHVELEDCGASGLLEFGQGE